MMTRFYDNLWEKKLSKLEALREAQLWMLREVPKNGALRGEIVRGLKIPKEFVPQENRPLPPFYWAAFVLSGDWR